MQNDNIEATQVKLKALQSQGIDTYGVFRSFFFYVFVEQTPSCPEFIKWCIKNYSPFKGVIMDVSRYRLMCPINSLKIQNTLLIPSEFTQMSSEYNEADILHSFQGASNKQKDIFLPTCLKPKIQLSEPSFPIDFDLFNEETQFVITLVIQFLGMDLNQSIIEPLLSLIFTLSTCQTMSRIPNQSSPLVCLQFDKFLAKNINAQLSNLIQSRTFRFQSLLMNMFLSFNDDDLQLPEMVMIKDMHIDYCKFMNSLMAPVYEVLFQERLSRFLPEMKGMLQSSPKITVRDWFLSEDNTVIRVYGFTRQPYVLPTFLTLRVFAIELIRQRLTVENEHFISFKK